MRSVHTAHTQHQEEGPHGGWCGLGQVLSWALRLARVWSSEEREKTLPR